MSPMSIGITDVATYTIRSVGNDTAPELAGWRPSPNGRGTMDIIWSCLTTLFICLWASLHLNIPADRDTSAKQLRRKLKWIGVSLVAPEWVTYLAVNEWRNARLGAKALQEAGLTEWTTTHVFFAEMGGIRLEVKTGDSASASHILANQEVIMRLLRQNVLPQRLRELRKEDIQGLSKADGLVKALACVQVTWLVIQSIARTAQSLPLTTLELSTIAYVVYAIMNYALWWAKPLDVTVRVDDSITLLDDNFIAEVRQLTWEGKGMTGNASDLRLINDFERSVFPMQLPRRLRKLESMELTFAAVPASALIFAGIHFVAWNYVFPSEVETLLWRVACLVTVIAPWAAWAILEIGFYHREDASTGSVLVGVVVSAIYALSRVYQIAEVIAGLRGLPLGCFETVDWSRYFPHVV